MPPNAASLIDRQGLSVLLRQLQAQGYEVIGPCRRDGALVYDRIAGLDDLPAGWTADLEAGRYRLRERDDAALFGYVVGPNSAKNFLNPARQTVFWMRRVGDELQFSEPEPPRPLAILGIRACDLAAIAIQDQVFLQGAQVDQHYAVRRENALLIAVNCNEPGGTCFCVSMGTGPRASQGHDLALTELLDDQRHAFLVEVGSARGRDLLAALPGQPATEDDAAQAEAQMCRAAGRMGRQMETEGIQQLLYDNPEHPRWNDVAERCLACTNCTMVCPTCFCHQVKDDSTLDGSGAERVREWDSCFSTEFSYMHGGAVRQSVRSRYRQWLTHKLAAWIDQFGSSGCVGCGRCITWCPTGIDLTEEIRAMRAQAAPAAPGVEEIKPS